MAVSRRLVPAGCIFRFLPSGGSPLPVFGRDRADYDLPRLPWPSLPAFVVS